MVHVYRLEYPDGGGPWFKPDGSPRNELLPAFPPDDCKCGCITLQALDDYMRERNIDIHDCVMSVYIYEVDKILRTSHNSEQVEFSMMDVISKNILANDYM